MKRKVKKILTSLLTIILMLSLMACGSKEVIKDSKISLNNDIPKSGIVDASIFAQLMESKEMAMFNGKNDEFTYQWMFIGSDIKEPEDINLLINPTNKNLDEVKKQSKSELVQGFSFNESKELKSKTALSITLNKKWKCSSADIYKYDEQEKTVKKVYGATVETSDNTIVNFSVKDRLGEFYIVASDPKQEAIDKDEKNGNSETAQSETSQSKKSQSEKKEESSLLKEQLGINTEKGTPNEGGKDKYLTDPIPEGKPKPIEWNEASNKVDKSKVAGYCTLSIRCDTLLKPENRKVAISNGKGDMIPDDGVIYATKKVKFYKNESVFDVLLREVQEQKIHMEFSMTPIYNSNYIEGINNLYEFDGGELSGWMYKVNGWYPNYGCSRYQLKDGDVIEWVYTCDLGRDVGCEWMGGKE
ncbi:DUF4430 domain-containing protein [Clostridium sp. CCUG 7971]|uniref:DUF4430 domain-containing protein n=1 Tax=Clostridium sp. CCUG 7971 TaxID=2811414 RepID=UPI00336C2ED4